MVITQLNQGDNMPQSLHVLSTHIIYSTKNRSRYLTPAIRPKLFAYMSGILRNLECELPTVNGVDDHVHVLCNLTKKLPLMKVLEILKKDSSKWLKTQPGIAPQFGWQNGYGAFSVSPGHREATREYILNQEDHHKQETFQEEFRRIMRKYGVKFDERYVWD